MASLTALDLAFLLVVAWFAVDGVLHGFVRSVFDLAVLALTLFVATTEFAVVGSLAQRQLGWSPSVSGLAGFGAIVLAGEAMRVAGGALVRSALAPLYAAFPVARYADELAGVAPGAARGAIYAAVLIVVVEGSGLAPSMPADIARSAIAGRVIPPVAGVVPSMANLVAVVVDGRSAALPQPEPNAVYRLPLPPGVDASVSPSDEAQILQMTNLARSQQGLPPYESDPALTEVARQHSQEMLREAYLAHDSPTSGTPVDRLRAAGVDFGRAGENIAYAPSIALAFQGLMQSPEHRQNILSADFRRIGVGVGHSGLWGFLVTQDFTD